MGPRSDDTTGATVAESRHRAAVDAWLERAVDHSSKAELIGLFRGAFEALWDAAVTTLGSVTLLAIAERVLTTATGQHAFLSAVNPRPNGEPRWKQQLQDRLSSVPRAELLEGLRFGLIELLSVIGRLTAEILSDDLHAAIAAIAVIPAEPKPPNGPQDGPSTAGKVPS